MCGYVSFSINIMDKLVRNFIAKQNVIDSDLCDSIVEQSKEFKWETHTWYSHHDKVERSHEEKELDVCHGGNVPSLIQEQLFLHVNAVYKNYVDMLISELEHPNFNMIKYWSACRINRYPVGTCMRAHYDHIHSLFDGDRRGIPTISVIGALNDNFKGGNLIFWDDFEVTLDKGDVLLFPSNFMYPHRVEEVTEGERYTFVTWGS